MDAADLQQLRDSCLPLQLPGPSPTPLLQRYLEYYSIDFAAQLSDVAHSVGWIPSGGDQLVVHVWRQPGAVQNLLLVHGYTDHVGIYGHAIRYGLSRGFNVVAFDQPGHGLSTGAQVAIDDFHRYGTAIADVLDAG